ncbi:MAG: four helix bundle protein [Bacteroidales bacterium]|nr:four helix bundle protein [Bacteroidales bacterium]
MEEKVPSFFRFEDLRIYGKAVDYCTWLIKNLRDPRNENERTFCRSFVNSASNIALNIAEGSSRNKTQFDHYLKLSKSAIRECVIFTTMARDLGLLSDEDEETSRNLLMEHTRMVGALIISLQRGSRRMRDTSESEFDTTDLGTDITSDEDFMEEI